MTAWRKAGVADAGTTVVLATAGAMATAFVEGFGGSRVALLCWLAAGLVAVLTGLLGVLLSRPHRRPTCTHPDRTRVP